MHNTSVRDNLPLMQEISPERGNEVYEHIFYNHNHPYESL